MLANKNIGFIGAGNMAGAIIRGLLNQEMLKAEQIWVSDVDQQKRSALSDELNIKQSGENSTLIHECDVVVLAVKPQVIDSVLAEIADKHREEQLFISIAAGIKTEKLEAGLKEQPKVVRVMPNTPALIGCGAAAICAGKYSGGDDLQITKGIFDAVGISVIVEEEQIDAVTGLSGSGPAYFFMMIEQMIEAGIAQGLSAEVSAELVKQTALGAARMVQETEFSPTELREMVTSPNGTTFAGLEKLREGGFPELVKACVARATERSVELGK